MTANLVTSKRVAGLVVLATGAICILGSTVLGCTHRSKATSILVPGPNLDDVVLDLDETAEIWLNDVEPPPFSNRKPMGWVPAPNFHERMLTAPNVVMHGRTINYTVTTPSGDVRSATNFIIDQVAKPIQSPRANEPLRIASAVARHLLKLAARYWTQGAYAKAEPLLVKVLQLCERMLGTQHPDVALSLNNLAVLYLMQGTYDKAKPLLERALHINEAEYGVMHDSVANSLSNLAMLYNVTGRHADAERLYDRALVIRETLLGGRHPDVALSLNNLAFFYSSRRAYSKAEALHARALTIYQQVRGPFHPDVALGLNNLASVYAAQAAHGKAIPLMVRALHIQEKTLGRTHPDVATICSNLASLHLSQGAYDQALLYETRAAEIRERQLRLEFSRLSESRMRALMMTLQGETEAVVSLHADWMPSSPQALELALTTVLRRKGRSLDALADNRLRLRAHLTAALRDKLDQLSSVSAEISDRMREPFDPKKAAHSVSELPGLYAKFDELESALNEASAEFRAQSESITIEKVQARLPHGSVLIEFVRYHRFDARRSQPWGEARYVAYVLPWQGQPRWVSLGEAAPIDAAVDAVRAAMQRGTDASTTKLALRHLDELVLESLRNLTEAAHIILSPDSKLNLVPFEALIDSQGHYEMEQRLVSYVTSGRDLLRVTRYTPRAPATLIAAPDYGQPRSGALSPGTFRPLPGALAEAAELPAYFRRIRTLTSGMATKAALAETVGAEVIHIATHGFYAGRAGSMAPAWHRPSADAATSFMPAAFSATWESRGVRVEFVTLASPHTLWSQDLADASDRAGLAMAGANVASDGIVSARELAGYDWWGTQLVVLSACETGVGAVPSGDGVYGMRRALVLAGAESQVVSLWNVNDSSTLELMQAFYDELARRTGRAEALRRAKLRLLQHPRYAHPYYWAAFIQAGDWSPLGADILKPAVQ
jgi:CHAT domain-containing protein/tetratricopeptide (TPR) repeat protein